MQAYLDLLDFLLKEGQVKEDRTGVGTLSSFGYQVRFELQEGFPILTTKRVPFGLIKSELLWFLKGDTNIQYLLKNNNHIWDEWAFEKWVQSKEYKGPDMTNFGLRAEKDPAFKEVYQDEMDKFTQRIVEDDDFAAAYGDLGPVYGKQWRSWTTSTGESIDQIQNILDTLRTNPDSRRIILSAWNPEDVKDMALPPCHTMSQFYVQDGKLSCQLYQRSGDAFLGVPFNIASYALLTHLIARELGLEPGEFIHTFGDLHLYRNHIDQAKEQLQRQPRPLPQLVFQESASGKSIFDLEKEDMVLEGYDPHPPISAPVAV